MITANYRVDPVTGALIFKSSAGRRKSQQTKLILQDLIKRVENLEQENIQLKNIIKQICSDKKIE